MQRKKLEVFRASLLGLYTILFLACFGNIGLSMYYLSALALDSFQTSAVFTGVLLTGFLLLVSSVWGCHRTKDVRSHSNTVSRISFTLLFCGLLACFITWTVSTKRAYDLIAGTASQPLDYWATHLGRESRLLYNFAVEFTEMWESGGCSGNDCVYTDCRGDVKVETTPLECDDEGMTAQFNYFTSRYSGTPTDLRNCISLVNDIKNKTGDLAVPTVTWCESRELFLKSARNVNMAMFGITLIQSICIFLSIVTIYYYMFLVRTELPDLGSSQSGWRIRRNLTDSAWLRSLDEERTT
jgi:hypothetical protein